MSAPILPQAAGKVIAVLDCGKTNTKVVLLRPDGTTLGSRTTANTPLPAPPYSHFDLARTEAWFLDQLADLARSYQIGAIIPSGHGSGAVLVDEAGPVLPMLDYDQNLPPELDLRYRALARGVEQTDGPIRLGASHLGRQLFWQQSLWPQQVSRAKALLALPQYWAWRLSGVMASELTSLSTQTHLWNIAERRASDLADRMGWAGLLPPPIPAWQELGPLRPAMAARTGIGADVPVLCGMHDSSANFYRYQAAGFSGFTLVSTGSWVVSLSDGFDPAALCEQSPVSCFADVTGAPVGGLLFMGGREFALLTEGIGAEHPRPEPADIAALIAAESMVLPSLVRFDGVIPGAGGRGRQVGAEPQGPAARLALATLYVALLADAGLTRLGGRGRVIVDGPFAGNALFLSLLAALRPEEEILFNTDTGGTAAGAALLAGHAERDNPVQLEIGKASPANLPGLKAYAARWRAAAAAVATG